MVDGKAFNDEMMNQVVIFNEMMTIVDSHYSQQESHVKSRRVQ
jgi:hypothetical protein